MDRYYVNNSPQSNGDHEVHKEGCFWLSLVTSKRDLGLHSGCSSAVVAAKYYYSTANGCATCAPSCHTS